MAVKGMHELQFVSPLRYPGGKGRLQRFIHQVLRLNGLIGGHYVEPYAGGAGIAIALLILDVVERVHINDFNRSIFAFWSAVLNETDELCRLVRETPITMDEWYRQRAVQDEPEPDPLALAFSTFFLNRCNRSGIIRGGVIGGKKQTGPWKLDARFNRPDLIRRIERVATFRDRISLYRQDAGSFLTGVLPTVPRRALVYLDPPYYMKGKGLYEDHYSPADHAEIARLVRAIRQFWVVSYDDVLAIRRLYAGLRQETFGLNYSAHRRFRGTEVMIFCDDLDLPPDIAPSRGVAA